MAKDKDKFVPYEKMSKKAQSEIDKLKRGAYVMDTGPTKVLGKDKSYNRNEIRKEKQKGFDYDDR